MTTLQTDLDRERAGAIQHLLRHPLLDVDGDRDAYARFFGAMLDAGVLLPPSPFEAWFPGFAHDDAVVDRILEAAATAFAA